MADKSKGNGKGKDRSRAANDAAELSARAGYERDMAKALAAAELNKSIDPKAWIPSASEEDGALGYGEGECAHERFAKRGESWEAIAQDIKLTRTRHLQQPLNVFVVEDARPDAVALAAAYARYMDLRRARRLFDTVVREHGPDHSARFATLFLRKSDVQLALQHYVLQRAWSLAKKGSGGDDDDDDDNVFVGEAVTNFELAKKICLNWDGSGEVNVGEPGR